jgi:hypothetical protein
MPIDASIPLGYKPIQTPNMLAAAAQGQEMSLNALKMQEATQSIADRNALRNLDPNAPDYISQVGRVNPKLALELQKGRTEARTAELDQRTKIGTLLKTSATPVIANPTFENAVTALQNFSKATGDDVTAEFNTLQKIGNNPEAIKKWAMGHALSGDQILAQTDLTANQKADLGIKREQLGVSKGHLDVARQGLTQGAIPAGYRMSADGKNLEAIPGGPTTTSLAPKEVQRREANYSKATQAVKTVEAKSKTLLEDIQLLKNHPGLDEITGVAGGRLPGYSSSGRAAKAIYDRIIARGGFTELQDMRNASSTGGALGNVSNQEGQQLRDAWAAISRIQDAKDLRNQLTRAETDVSGSVQRIREAYDMDYEYKGSKAPTTPSPTPSAGGNTVTTPDGKTLTFPTPEAAAQFKKAAKIGD